MQLLTFLENIPQCRHNITFCQLMRDYLSKIHATCTVETSLSAQPLDDCMLHKFSSSMTSLYTNFRVNTIYLGNCNSDKKAGRCSTA